MTVLSIAPFIEAESDRIVADDLIAGPQSYTVTQIDSMAEEGKKRLVLHLDGSKKPFIPCKGMARLLGHLWGGVPQEWVGRSLTLYRDPDVRFGKDTPGGVRICAMSDIARPAKVPVRTSQRSVKTYDVAPLQAPASEPPADRAAAWADGYIADLRKIETASDLADFANREAKRLAALEAKRPELHVACIGALEKRRAELTPEGRADEQHGDQFDGTEDDPF